MGYTGTNSACQPTRLEVLSSTHVNATDRRKIHFVFTGPSHMNLFIDAKKSTLTSWYVLVLVTAGIQDRDQDLGVLMGSPFVHVFDRSMGNGISGPVVEAEDAYILQFCSGTVPSNYHFWIEAESNKSIDVVFVAHYLELITPEMTEFLDALPSWTVVSAFASTWTKLQI